MVQADSVNKKIIVVCGPTASGKTSLAVKIADKLGSEVISADSMLIYKGFDIGTAKPTAEEMHGVKHHMIDVAGEKEKFSVADYRAAALPIIGNLIENGKIPVVCGGTGFYINSLLYDFSYGNAPENPEIRRKYEIFLSENGNSALFEILKEKDPESSKILHPNDVKRVIRALEIFDTGGKPKSFYKDELSPRCDFIAVSYDFPREELYKRIDKRVDMMVSQGLFDEVKGLLDSGVSAGDQSMQGIGYKESAEFLSGICGFDETVKKIKMNTRRYAKRQITFFKRLEGLKYLSPEDDENKVISYL